MVSKVADMKFLSRPEMEVDVSDLLIQYKDNQNNSLVEEVELKQGEQARIFLGIFKPRDIPKGFSVLLSPKSVDPEEIIKQITKLELQDNHYELILHIANYSSKVVSAEVRKLT